MNKRLFTFGCSFTSWKWPTWNDYIGLNFDKYYTLGCGGADNKNILYRLLQADKKYKFTSDDTIMIMFTSFNRMSYVGEKDFWIHNIGDLVDHNVKAHPIGKNYNFATAVYDSCIAIQSIESILKSKNVKYEFLQSMKHDFYNDDFEMSGDVKEDLNYCLDLFKYPVMENWVYENYDFMKEKIIWQDEGSRDGHPTMKHHFDFVKEFFPQYITDKVIQYYDIQQENFSDENAEQQEEIYRDIQKEFLKMKKLRLIRNNSFDTITAPTLEELNHEKNKLELENGYLYDVCCFSIDDYDLPLPTTYYKMASKTIRVFKTKTIEVRNDDEQWNDVRILNDTGGKDKETSTVLPQSNIQKNNDIVKDYLTFQPMTIFTPDYWYCNSVEFNAVAQYYKCGYDVFAKEDWDSWYESQGQDMISTEERKYLPFVNYIKMLGYNYE